MGTRIVREQLAGRRDHQRVPEISVNGHDKDLMLNSSPLSLILILHISL